MKEKLSEHQEVLEAIEYAIAKTAQEETQNQSIPKGHKALRVVATSYAEPQSTSRKGQLAFFLFLTILVGAAMLWFKFA